MIHLLVGAIATVVWWKGRASPSWMLVLAVAFAGTLHEVGDGDLVRAWLVGVKDVALFLPVPVGYWAFKG